MNSDAGDTRTYDALLAEYKADHGGLEPGVLSPQEEEGLKAKGRARAKAEARAEAAPKKPRAPRKRATPRARKGQ